MAKSKLPSAGTGGGSVTKDLLNFGKKLKNIAGKIYRGVVGPEQEQTYGWTEQFFPSKPKREKEKKSSVQQNFYSPAQNLLGPAPGMGMDTEEILNLMKENYADEKRYREVQKSFAEERAGEEEKRHKELVTAIKLFTGTKTTATAVDKKEEGGGLMELLQNIMNSIKEKFDAFVSKVEGWINDLKDTIGKILEKQIFKDALSWFKGLILSPAFVALGIAALLGGIVMAEIGIEIEKLKKLAGKAGEELGGRRITEEALGTVAPGALGEAIMNEAAGKPSTSDEISDAIRAKQNTMARLLEDQGFTVEGVDKNGGYLFEDSKGNPPSAELYGAISKQADAIVAKYPLGMDPKNLRSIANINENDVPRLKPLEGVYKTDFMTDEELSKPAFVRPHGIKSAPVPPPPSPVVQLTDMNRDLEMYTTPMGDVGGPIIQQSNTQSAQNEPPLPSTATQRDDEPMAAFVFRTQRRKARAY